MAIPTRFASPATSTTSAIDKDSIVQDTDRDALVSRWSAVHSGYLTDPFIELLFERQPDRIRDRRYPLINRGTYIRTIAVDRLVEGFLSSGNDSSKRRKKQIISLGAGSDTRFFRLASSALSAGLLEDFPFTYHEFDFPQVTRRKINAIRTHGAMSSIISSCSRSSAPNINIEEGSDSLQSENYYIHSLDLRTLKPGSSLPSGIDPSLPTLFISECCLIYLSPNETDDIFRWITSSFGKTSETHPDNGIGIVLYEPIGGEDAFGKVMIQNLSQRGIVLKTLKKYSNLDRQKERMRVLGFNTGMNACDVNFIHDYWTDEREKERIDRLELLDEREEWVLLAKHYCVAWGWKDIVHDTSSDGSNANVEGRTAGLFDNWNNFPRQR